MLSYVFNRVLLLSLCFSAVFIVFMAVFRVFGKIISARLRYYFLIIPMLLCLIPVGTGSLSFIRPVEQTLPKQTTQSFTQQTTQSTQAGVSGTAAVSSQTDLENAEDSVPPQSGTENVERSKKISVWNSREAGRYINIVEEKLSYVWVLGVMLLLLYRLFSTVKLKTCLKRIEEKPNDEMQSVFECMNVSKRVRLKCFRGVSTPFIMGILRPVIFVPDMQMSEYELCLALKHELTHIRRHDLVIKALADFVSVIHFFNPFVYFLRKSVNTYCELSCDEDVVKTMDDRQCRDYGRMLLIMMKKKNTFMQSTACLSEGEKNIKKRLEIIMRGNRAGRFSAAVGIILALILVSSSIVCAGAVGSLDNSVLPKESYQGAMNNNLAITEDGRYISRITKNGTASYLVTAGRIAFKAGYQEVPENVQKKVDDLTAAKKYDEACAILDDESAYTDYYELTLDKKLRSYGDGYGLEGLFTLKRNNETVFEKQTGYLNSLPPYAGNTWQTSGTELYIEYTDSGKNYLYRANYVLDSQTPQQLEQNRKLFAAMDRSKQTHSIKLGEIEEVIDNGVSIDTNALNIKLLSENKPWENSVATIEYNTDMQLAQLGVPIGYGKYLSIWQGEKVSCDADSIRGSFRVMDECVRDFIPMTMSGLSNPIGGYVEIKSDDGKYYAKYKIVQDIPQPLPIRGTKEVSDFMVQGEKVFVGTPREQDEFDKDDHSELYKRIITDDYGKVIAVVPIEWQEGDNIVLKGNEEHGCGYTWQNLFGSGCYLVRSDENGKMEKIKDKLVLQDPGTWYIRAVIPVENQFFDYIEQ